MALLAAKAPLVARAATTRTMVPHMLKAQSVLGKLFHLSRSSKPRPLLGASLLAQAPVHHRPLKDAEWSSATMTAWDSAPLAAPKVLLKEVRPAAAQESCLMMTQPKDVAEDVDGAETRATVRAKDSVMICMRSSKLTQRPSSILTRPTASGIVNCSGSSSFHLITRSVSYWKTQLRTGSSLDPKAGSILQDCFTNTCGWFSQNTSSDYWRLFLKKSGQRKPARLLRRFNG